MSLRIIVLAKQVPDTRNVGKDAMTAEGTVNRAALPAIFNPEDLNALEQALRLKESHPGSTVTLLTMGPGRAAEIIREGLYRGADGGYLLTDRAFAGADTLYRFAVSLAVLKPYNFPCVVFHNRVVHIITDNFLPVSYRLIAVFIVVKILKNRLVPVKNSNTLANDLNDIFFCDLLNICICNFSTIFAFYKVLQMHCVHNYRLKMSFRCCNFSAKRL